VPLIDHELARQVLALPGSQKVGGRTPKRLLVEALHGALPESIVSRPKRGFTLPFERWLRGNLRAEVEGAIRRIGNGPLERCLNPSAALDVWNRFLRGETSWSRPWALFVLQKWSEQNL
jgi:asparagine synthase (glutamine-hydrolysing)